MNYYLEMAIYFTASYILSFIVYVLFINSKKRKNELAEIKYIIEKFKLDRDKLNTKKLKWILSFINPFIISITFMIIINIESYILGIMIGFVVMMILVYSVYEIIGRCLKRGERKNVQS